SRQCGQDEHGQASAQNRRRHVSQHGAEVAHHENKDKARGKFPCHGLVTTTAGSALNYGAQSPNGSSVGPMRPQKANWPAGCTPPAWSRTTRSWPSRFSLLLQPRNVLPIGQALPPQQLWPSSISLATPPPLLCWVSLQLVVVLYLTPHASPIVNDPFQGAPEG